METEKRASELRERLEALLTRFVADGISHKAGKGLDRVLEYQDVVGRATPTELRLAYEGMGREYRRLFVWASCSCLGADTAQQVILYTFAASIRDRELASLNRHFDAESARIDEASKLLEAAKKHIYRRLRDARREIVRLQGRVEYYRNESDSNYEAYQRERDQRRANDLDAGRYRQLVALLKTSGEG